MPLLHNNFVKQNPTISLRRSKFDLSHPRTTDFSAGHLIPISCVPVLPGDSFSCDVSSLVRMLTPEKPFMDNIFCDIYAFYAPSRILWKHAKAYYSGGTDNDPNTGSGNYTTPTIYTKPKTYIRGDYTVRPCSTLDYLGVARDSTGSASNGVYVDALPLRATAMIWNRFFRDENLMAGVLVDTGDTGAVYTDPGSNVLSECSTYSTFQQYAMNGFYLFPVCRIHDYFSSCLPAPTKGGNVTIFDNVQIGKDGTTPIKFGFDDPINAGLNLVNISALQETAMKAYGSEQLDYISGPLLSTKNSINSLIQAFAINELMTRDARYGSRYEETLYGQFGVSVNSDLIDEPVYLGGKRFNIQVNQVLQTNQPTTSSTTDAVGNIGASSVSADASYLFTSSFKEHGYMLIYAVVRAEHKYSQGIDAFWTKFDRLQEYWPALNNIADQPVYKKELYNTVLNQDRVFGYKEAWSEYRYVPGRVTGHFRPGVTGALTPWSLADLYVSEPSLSADWIREPWELIDRISYTTTTPTTKQFYGDFYVKLIATRCIGTYSIPAGLTGRF